MRCSARRDRAVGPGQLAAFRGAEGGVAADDPPCPTPGAPRRTSSGRSTCRARRGALPWSGAITSSSRPPSTPAERAASAGRPVRAALVRRDRWQPGSSRSTASTGGSSTTSTSRPARSAGSAKCSRRPPPSRDTRRTAGFGDARSQTASGSTPTSATPDSSPST